MKQRISEIAQGLYMVTLPMPFRLKHVNVFVAIEDEGFTLIDTGANLPGTLPALEASLAEIGRRVEDCRRLILTHYHTDHSGLAGLIAARSGAAISMSEIDAMTIEAFAYAAGRTERTRRFAFEHGLDDQTLDAVEAAFHALRSAMSPFSATDVLLGGEKLTVGGRGMEVIPTPGHTRGHLSLYLPVEQILLAGDHVLPHITPNLSPDLREPAFRPLQAFLESLERVEPLPVKMVYPAHGAPFADLKGRVAEMRDHHHERKGLAFAAVASCPKTAAEISHLVFGEDLPAFDRLLALNETYVHLLELEQEERIERTRRDGRCFFSPRE